MQKLAKVLRVVTLPPIMALLSFTIIFLVKPDIFGSWVHYFLSLVFLVIFPLFAYPLQLFLPPFKNQGRKGQRNLAIIMSILGYVFSVGYAFVFHVPLGLKELLLSYLISGALVGLISKATNVKASGHACGVAGPIVYLIYFLGWWYVFGVLLLLIVCWASIKTKRHNRKEFLFGSMIPLLGFSLAVFMLTLV